MPYDQTGATVGAAGHDAATIVAAEIAVLGAEGLDAFERWRQLRDQILADSLQTQGVTAVTQGTNATPISSAPSSSGGDNSNVAFKGGKYEGKTIGELYADESGGRDYLEWIEGNDSYKNDFMRSRIKTFLAAKRAA